VLFEADVPSSYAADHPLGKLTRQPYTPVFVFLDTGGRKILETRGFRTAREARALHEFVARRHYRKTSWENFLAAWPGAK
jgi:thioredoxin-related protein